MPFSFVVPRFLAQTILPFAESMATSLPPLVATTRSFWNPNWSRWSRDGESGEVATAEVYEAVVSRLANRTRYPGKSWTRVVSGQVGQRSGARDSQLDLDFPRDSLSVPRCDA